LNVRVRSGALEITDLLWSFDALGERLPVRRDEAVSTLRSRGQHRAARVVERIPVAGGELDPAAVDALGLRVHRELQRLGEELQLGRRVAELVAELLAQLVDGLPAGGGPVRVVDIGCGLGHVLRAIAARGDLPSVDLVGVDLNPVLVAEAHRLAAHEDLDCTFVPGSAFEPGLAVEDGPRTIMMSSGLLHHLSRDELTGFFAAQERLGVAAFAHRDIAPCFWSTAGAWIFHRARMREAVSRHDGVLSAVRAHPAEHLLDAAGSGAPSYDCEVREGGRWHPRALDVLRPLVGVRR
jgi:SAM-dependent methyltransferase